MGCSILRVFVCLCLARVILTKAESKEEKAYVVVEGDHFSITCNATEESGTRVYWTKNGTSGSFVQNGTELVFVHISRVNSGEYLCQEANETDAEVIRTLETVSIDVQYPGKVASFIITQASTMEFEPITISCVIEGNPAPRYEIVNNYTKTVIREGVTVGNITATNNHSTCMDNAEWYCVAYNKLNEKKNSSMKANATVYCAPIPDPDMESKYTILTVIGAPAVVFMNYISNPAPNTTWEQDGHVFNSTFVQTTNTVPSGFMALTVTDVRLENFLSNLSLTMTNSIGSHVAEYRFISYGKPYTPQNLHATDIASSSATIVWTSGFDMGTEQHFKLMGWVPGVGYIQIKDDIYVNYTNRGVNQTCTYHLDRLTSGMDYKLGVVAENAHYASAMSEPTEFTTKGKRKPTQDSSHHKTGIIVGGSVGGVCAVALVALGAYCLIRRRRTSRDLR